MTAAPVQLLHHALDLDVDLDERLLQAHSDFCIVVRPACASWVIRSACRVLPRSRSECPREFHRSLSIVAK
jgi:hypothetical protein